jgi:hypothetical protein
LLKALWCLYAALAVVSGPLARRQAVRANSQALNGFRGINRFVSGLLARRQAVRASSQALRYLFHVHCPRFASRTHEGTATLVP